MDNQSAPLLTVENLKVAYRAGKGYNNVVKGVSFELGRERLGIVGESGSGKSTIGRALLKLLPTAKIDADRMDFSGTDLLNASEREMLAIRGRRISMILQDPKFSLNPVHRVGDQVAEATASTTRPPPKSRARRRWKCWRRCRSAIPNASSASTPTKFPAAWASAS